MTTTETSNTNRGFLAAISGAFVLSFTSILIRVMVILYQMPALILSYWRELFAAVIMAGILAVFKPEHLKGIRQHLPILVAFGFALALMNALWTSSVVINGASIATAMVYISGAFSAVLGRIFLNEALTPVKIAAVVISIVGCVLVANAYDVNAWRLNFTGIVIGTLSGLAYAIYSLMGRTAGQRGINPWVSLMAAFGFASFFMLFFNLAFGRVLPGGATNLNEMLWLGNAWAGWGILLILAAGPTLLGFGLYNVSLKDLPASVANLILTAEPVFTAIVAYFLLGEVLTLIQVLGGLLILTGVVLLKIGKPGKAA